MQIYHHGVFEKPDVPAAAPSDANEGEAKSVFGRLRGEGSFLGVVLGDGRTLQLYRNADGTLYAEVLKEEAMSIRYCTVNAPLAELLLEAAFRKEDFEQKIGFSRITWCDHILKRA